MLPEPKYDRFRDEPLRAAARPRHPPAVPMPAPAPAHPGAAPGLAQPCPAAGEEPEAGTTFCMLLPRMPQWKFPGPGGFLSRRGCARPFLAGHRRRRCRIRRHRGRNVAAQSREPWRSL